MSDLDLTAAVEAVAREDWQYRNIDAPGYVGWEDADESVRESYRLGAVPLVEAAAPIIERQVREQVERLILDLYEKTNIAKDDPMDQLKVVITCAALWRASQIARGERDER